MTKPVLSAVTQATPAGDLSFTTSGKPAPHRSLAWQEAVGRIYYPQDILLRSHTDFSGRLDLWTLGEISISRNVSDAILYRRREAHLQKEREEAYLITIPERSETRFKQGGRDVRCRPGAFLIERSLMPYEFSHSAPNALWVLKIPATTLRARIGQPERLATLTFDATDGVGALFVEFLQISIPRLSAMNGTARAVLGHHLVDLLGLAIEADRRTLGGGTNATQSAYLQRAERFIRDHLRMSDLAPRQIAEGMGISLRSLHGLFERQGTTVCGWIREQRLLMCDEALRDGASRKSISEVAYQWGFGDQAQFSRHYRARFGRTPTDTRAATRRRID